MKTLKMIKLYTIGVFALMSFGVNAQTNLLLNGSFEGTIGADNLPESWINFAPQSAINLSLATLPANVFAGTKALNISFDPGTNIEGGVSQTISGITTGSEYDVTYFYKYTETLVLGSVGGSSLQWLNDANEDVPPVDADASFFFGQECPPISQGIFLPIAFKVTAPPTATKLFIFLTTIGPLKNFIFDDVKIIKRNSLGLNEISKENQLKIHTKDSSVFISTEGGEKILVHNLLGQKLSETIGEKNITTVNNLSKNQVLIVSVDNKTQKIILN